MTPGFLGGGAGGGVGWGVAIEGNFAECFKLREFWGVIFTWDKILVLGMSADS